MQMLTSTFSFSSPPPPLQLKSMVRSRTDLFDFSAAALVAGGLTSAALFAAGLVASHGGAAPEVGPGVQGVQGGSGGSEGGPGG